MPIDNMRMWTGHSWLYQKRWENFTKKEKERWKADHPDKEEPQPKQLCHTPLPQKRAR